MKRHTIQIDGRTYIDTERLRAVIAAGRQTCIELPGVWLPGSGGKEKPANDPLTVDAYLCGDESGFDHPTLRISVSSALRKELKKCKEGGYAGWPGMKMLRDRMADLVAEMDRWDKRTALPPEDKP